MRKKGQDKVYLVMSIFLAILGQHLDQLHTSRVGYLENYLGTQGIKL